MLKHWGWGPLATPMLSTRRMISLATTLVGALRTTAQRSFRAVKLKKNILVSQQRCSLGNCKHANFTRFHRSVSGKSTESPVILSFGYIQLIVDQASYSFFLIRQRLLSLKTCGRTFTARHVSLRQVAVTQQR